MDGKIAIVLGTRPEFIKMAPTVAQLKAVDGLACDVIFTNQHPDLGPQTAGALGIEIDAVLDPLPGGRSMTELLGHLVTALAAAIPPEVCLLVVQGDTLSALAGSLVSELMDVPLVHVEAGVRSGVKSDPFPEEINRRLISQVADLHLCFSRSAEECLLAEGHDAGDIRRVAHPLATHVSRLQNEPGLPAVRSGLLVTLHRRERRSERLEALPQIVKSVRSAVNGVKTILVSHPGVGEPAAGWLDDLESNGCEVVHPLPAIQFLRLLASSACVLTDSAGVAEEAELLGVPLAIFRSAPERRIDGGVHAAKTSSESPDELADFVVRQLERPASPTSTARPGAEDAALPSIAEEIRAYADKL